MSRTKLSLLLIAVGGTALLVVKQRQEAPENSIAAVSEDSASRYTGNRRFEYGSVVNWWDPIPEEIRSTSLTSTKSSNIHPDDYIGPNACRKCHSKNHAAWSEHPHHRMNALATPETVKGDFSGRTVQYLGGDGTFFRNEAEYRMRLERSGLIREYRITQTIGSRFYQYFVGRLIQGPEADDHPLRNVDHVLPFGYWIDRKEWVPTVHVHERGDPGPPLEDDPFARSPRVSAYFQCNSCHTTFPLADNYLRVVRSPQNQSPEFRIHLDMSDYISTSHPSLWQGHSDEVSTQKMREISQQVWTFEAPDHAVTLGISCEACHLGAKTHAVDPRISPDFIPSSPHQYVQYSGPKSDFDDPQSAPGRSVASLNWTCGRCHSGLRPQLAAGMAAWNSTEYSDALRGACYSQLKCIDCHNPHEAIGKAWSRSSASDDARCLKCHDQFQEESRRLAHTHHVPDSDGSRCMNCHMPYMNEGLQDVVRTHMIFSPTNDAMIKAGQPNACNQCHTDQSVNWTVEHLKQWYGNEVGVSTHATENPDKPASLNWLASDNHSVRLLAVDCLVRTDSRWAVPQILDALDDPILLNRQFARIGVEKLLDIRLEDFGYRFFMSASERKAPLDRLKAAILPQPTR